MFAHCRRYAPAYTTAHRGERSDRVVVATGGVGYLFSGGLRSAGVGDKNFRFTKKQAAVIEALYEARASGLHGPIRTRPPKPRAISGSCSFSATTRKRTARQCSPRESGDVRSL